MNLQSSLEVVVWANNQVIGVKALNIRFKLIGLYYEEVTAGTGRVSSFSFGFVSSSNHALPMEAGLGERTQRYHSSSPWVLSA
jgi:hypothetical protein